MFCEVIYYRKISWVPINFELPLFDAVYEPPELHVESLALILFDLLIHDTVYCTVVCLYQNGPLFVIKFF